MSTSRQRHRDKPDAGQGVTGAGSSERTFVIARNRQPDTKLPYLLRLPLEGGLVLKVRDTWPRSSRVYCHAFEEDWPKEADVLEAVPVLSCCRRGATPFGTGTASSRLPWSARVWRTWPPPCPTALWPSSCSDWRSFPWRPSSSRDGTRGCSPRARLRSLARRHSRTPAGPLPRGSGCLRRLSSVRRRVGLPVPRRCARRCGRDSCVSAGDRRARVHLLSGFERVTVSS